MSVPGSQRASKRMSTLGSRRIVTNNSECC